MDEDIKYVFDEISMLEVDCPECRDIDDEQYTCSTCECEGGSGHIDIMKFVTENKHFLDEYKGF